ncbi:2TM domain-containing protein [Ascidiimonas sp. W6]|uniref:2TM domain-containing protein n=1 Tax=Ascidiimonas meishanensis TaxID=3128903 RepID=UPI0030EDD99A
MFSKNKSDEIIDKEQHELLENAQKRISQKKKLYIHFVIFLVGSVFLIIVNKVLGYGETYDWFVWAITFWAFLFIIHLINVFITNKFMGKEWERVQREKLVKKQEAKISKLELEIEKQRAEKPSKDTL